MSTTDLEGRVGRLERNSHSMAECGRAHALDVRLAEMEKWKERVIGFGAGVKVSWVVMTTLLATGIATIISLVVRR